ncbi:MAG: GspH/FimT family pseudopilin [Ectothiorhodospiraceae bacterium]|nr:GspH/FimT family pseudopilin [Ectothiorhodospiraceae bacterium]MCH8503695.1 GspH/FimT family pseudopilin [Ectothiorhodospiraceae bacterium]
MDRNTGLSLIELVVVLLVVTVLAAVALPSFGRLASEQRLVTASNQLLTAIHLARSEAVRRGERVTLCASTDGQTCASSAGYHDGYIVFVGPPDANLSTPGGEAPLFVATASPQLLITGNGSMRDYVSYVSTGSTRQLNGALQMGTLRLCDGQSARRIVVSRTGRPRIERSACE